MYRRHKLKGCTTQKHMREADYRKYVSPMIYDDEKFVQLSIMIPEIKDYYWISNKGRIYSSYNDSCLATDLVRLYTHTTLSMKNGTSKVFDIRELYYQAFGIHYNYNQ